MTNFNNAFAADAGPALLAEFGETVTYRPRSGVTRSIAAIVIYNSGIGADATGTPLKTHGVENAPAIAPLIRVLNSATLGISGAELNLGGDKIDVPLRDGAAAQTLAIKELVSDNGGFLTVVAY